jgi:hypothetical protein
LLSQCSIIALEILTFRRSIQVVEHQLPYLSLLRSCHLVSAAEGWSRNLKWPDVRPAPFPLMLVSYTVRVVWDIANSVGCYGIASQDMGPEWECELCLNVKHEDNHLVSLHSPYFLKSFLGIKLTRSGTKMCTLPTRQYHTHHQSKIEAPTSGFRLPLRAKTNRRETMGPYSLLSLDSGSNIYESINVEGCRRYCEFARGKMVYCMSAFQIFLRRLLIFRLVHFVIRLRVLLYIVRTVKPLFTLRARISLATNSDSSFHS